LGGRMVAQKGEDAQAEAGAAQRAFAELGGALVDIKPVLLPGTQSSHYLVVLDKVARTPAGYPRRAGMPSKKPLR